MDRLMLVVGLIGTVVIILAVSPKYDSSVQLTKGWYKKCPKYYFKTKSDNRWICRSDIFEKEIVMSE